MRKLIFTLILQTALIALLAVSAFPQDCSPPQIVFNKNADNIFSEEQEMFLGQVIAEQVQKNYRIIDDEAVNRLVREIGAKLIRHLPASRLEYKFHVVDLPELNAFAFAGGNIYLTRKMIAFVRSEDELAGIIAHELGHGAVRHSAIDITQSFKKVLKVDQVTDRKDIFEKYNQLIDRWRTRPQRRNDGHENDQQLEADKIGVFAMTAAGYDPKAFTSAFDRLAATEGKTGGWLSNLFGATRPAEKRLGEMIKAVESLPAACLDKKSTVSAKQFEDWQTEVISYSNYAATERVAGVSKRFFLNSKLRDDINHLEFSRDGKYILAQDDSTIFVIEKEPFKFLFRIEAPEAKRARFSPDSSSIVFDTTSMRVERWSISARKPVFVREIFLRESCIQTALSNDGNMFACFSFAADFQITLRMLDVRTNEVMLIKEKFFRPDPWDLFYLFTANTDNDLPNLFQTEFSPDGRYFVAGRVFKTSVRNYPLTTGYTGIMSINAGASGILGYDLIKREEIKIGSDLRKIISSPFAFYTDSKIIGQNSDSEEKSGIFEFPSGKQVEKFTLKGDSITMAPKGNYVLVRPLKVAPVGVYDVGQKKFLIANNTPALDVFDNSVVSENKTGVLGLFKLDQDEVLGEIEMPDSRLGNIRSITVSPDLFWVAISDKSRGAVWSLYSGEMYFYVKGFRGAFFDKDGKIYSDFTKTEGSKRQVAAMDVRSKSLEQVRELDARNTRQSGRYLISIVEKDYKEKKEDENKLPDHMVENPGDYRARKNGLMEVRDVRTNEILWSRTFPDEVPGNSLDSLRMTMTLIWPLKSKAAKDIVKSDENLRRRLSDMGDKDGDYLVEVVDAETGKTNGRALIETGEGSFRIRSAFTVAKWLTVTDTENRVLFYSLRDGMLQHRFFGENAAVSAAGDLAAIENNNGQLSIYDLMTGEKLEELNFKTSVAYVQFDRYGKKLLVLTADQEVFLLDASKFAKSENLAIQD